MACKSLSGFTYDRCEPNLGGIKKVWLADYKEMTLTIDSATGDTENMVIGFSPASSAVTSVTWYEYPMRQNVASMTSTLQVGDEGGNWVQTDLNMVFSKMDTDKRVAMVSLIQAEAMAIVLDANNKYWFLGAENPLVISAGAGETGTAKSDPNHYTVTVQDAATEYPYEIDPTFAKQTIENGSLTKSV